MVETAGIRADRCQAYSAQPDPQAIARDIVARNGSDLSAIRRDLAAIEAQDTTLALQVRSAVEAQLTPVQQGQLAAAGYSVAAPDGAPIALSDRGLTVAEQRAAPAGSPAAEQYARFDRIWGDANPATDDVAVIEQGLRNMVASGLTVAQMEALGTLPPPANDTGPDTATLVADLAQMTLDLTGIVEPTPFSDGANTIISLGRSIGSAFGGNWGDAGGHLGNGVLSAVGIVPYLGDLAKAGKIGKWAQTVADTISAVTHNPALRQTFEPALREISDAVKKIPTDALNALPAGARESIEGMKRQLDEFFGAGARQVDDAGRAVVRNADGSLNMDQAAQAYADTVHTNRPWSWADNFSGTFTAGERSTIRQEAIARGLITEVPMKPGTRYPDFAGAGLVQRADTLPEHLWLKGDDAQFAWLDAQIPGGRPEGFTWHHTETPGRMELVPFGEHNINNHIGGRSPGHWAHAPR